MSDWDVFGTTEGQANENHENDNNDNDGMFLADNGSDNDDFIGENAESHNYGDNFHTPAFIEAQSFNPRLHNEALKNQDIFHYHPSYDNDLDKNQDEPPAAPTNYKDMSHSYTERKIHDAYFGPIKKRYHNKKYKNSRNMHRRRQHDASDTDFAIAAVTHELLESGFDSKRYKIFHDAAIHQRMALGKGKAPEMNSLFYFWCYYLREHFDPMMFTEFHELAQQDALANSHYGIECFFRFCSYGLEMRWDETVFGLFQTEALQDYKRGSLYGLEKVKGFLVHQKYDFSMEPFINPEISKVLQQFPTLESFKEKRREQFSKGRKQRSNSNNDNRPNHRNQQQQPKVTITVEKRTTPLVEPPKKKEEPQEPSKPKVEVTLPKEEDHSKIVFEHSKTNDGDNNNNGK